MRKLFVGPYYGEFGWEVAQFAPYVNRLSKEFDMTTIACMPGHAELYVHAKEPYSIRQCYSRPDGAIPDMMRMNGRQRPHVDTGGAQRWLLPEAVKIDTQLGVPKIAVKLDPVPLGTGEVKRKHVLVHARAITKCPERNWPAERWDELQSQFESMGIQPFVIGSVEDYRPGLSNAEAVDFRGTNLKNLIQLMREAIVVVGASSGPMHLAQMCEAPVVVWSGNARKDKPRYEKVWNHFDSPTKFVASTWQPGVKKVLEAVESFL